MSVSVVLVPFALAAAGLVGGTAGVASITSMVRGRPDQPAPKGVIVRTRMKDANLLEAALQSVGATSVTRDGTALTAEIGAARLTLDRDQEGIWQVHVESTDGVDVDEDWVEQLIGRLDTAYAALVQQTVAERIRQRAQTSGFELVSETVDDEDAVTMVLTVQRED